MAKNHRSDQGKITRRRFLEDSLFAAFPGGDQSALIDPRYAPRPLMLKPLRKHRPTAKSEWPSSEQASVPMITSPVLPKDARKFCIFVTPILGVLRHSAKK